MLIVFCSNSSSIHELLNDALKMCMYFLWYEWILIYNKIIKYHLVTWKYSHHNLTWANCWHCWPCSQVSTDAFTNDYWTVKMRLIPNAWTRTAPAACTHAILPQLSRGNIIHRSGPSCGCVVLACISTSF